MPEIVEVETIKNDLIRSNKILGHKIVNSTILSKSIVDKSAFKDFHKIKNKTIKRIDRIGKYLIFELDDLFMIVHLKMTGHIFLKDKNYELQKHDHLVINLDNGKELVYNDTRKFGKFYVKKDLSFLDVLGVDVLSKEFKFQDFYEILKTKRKKIKTLLMDQRLVAGLGNIYVDEVLFHAKIHPLKQALSLTCLEAKKLYLSIIAVIKKALKYRGTSLGKNKSNYSSIYEDFGFNQNHLLVHGKDKCPKCRRKVVKLKINGRTSYFCRHCQIA